MATNPGAWSLAVPAPILMSMGWAAGAGLAARISRAAASTRRIRIVIVDLPAGSRLGPVPIASFIWAVARWACAVKTAFGPGRTSRPMVVLDRRAARTATRCSGHHGAGCLVTGRDTARVASRLHTDTAGKQASTAWAPGTATAPARAASRAIGVGATAGRLAIGCQADVLVVCGDPTRDLGALWNVLDVWQAGHRVERGVA